MRRLVMVVSFFVLGQAAAFGQTTSEPRAWGYGFGAVGGTSSSVATLHVGGGGEGLVYKSLGLGAEVGYLSPFEDLGDGIGILSTNVAYHFVRPRSNQKLVPFVTGGFSLAFRSGASGGGNFGGGVQYWVRPRLGLRFEFRDHIFSSDTPHLYGFRVGLSFR
ncbi:MAG: hypothetical protein WAU45_24130 [Blastocatellia bacterium]